jgi:hypothetical protein
MSGFEIVGLLIGFCHLLFALLVAASLPLAIKKNSAAAGIMYIGLAAATVIWIARSINLS